MKPKVKVTIYLRPGHDDDATTLIAAGRIAARDAYACCASARMGDMGRVKTRTCHDRDWDGPACPKAAA